MRAKGLGIMKITISGKNIDVTEGLKAAVNEKLGKLEKYFTPDTNVIVTLSVEKERQKSLEIKDFKTKNILWSNYIQKNHDLPIQSTPHFINERTVNQLLKKSYHLPIIILYKNKKCLVNPFILNQELYGMCHIIVIPTNKEINYVQINYPNNEKEKLFYEKKFIQTLIQHIRYYMLQENEFYSFSELQQFEQK